MASGDIKNSGNNHPENMRLKNGVQKTVWKKNTTAGKSSTDASVLRAVTYDMANEEMMRGRGNWADNLRTAKDNKNEKPYKKATKKEITSLDPMAGRGNWAD